MLIYIKSVKTEYISKITRIDPKHLTIHILDTHEPTNNHYKRLQNSYSSPVKVYWRNHKSKPQAESLTSYHRVSSCPVNKTTWVVQW